VWDSSPGPGHPTLQGSGEAMFHYALPPSHTPAAVAAVEAMVRAWHLAPGRYSAAADMETRANDPAIQHLKFAYQVRGFAPWNKLALCMPDAAAGPAGEDLVEHLRLAPPLFLLCVHAYACLASGI
jgi:hypothetical protein